MCPVTGQFVRACGNELICTKVNSLEFLIGGLSGNVRLRFVKCVFHDRKT